MTTTRASVYVKLPQEGDFIRLLELFPGNQSEQLSGKLVVHDLLDTSRAYTATSLYVAMTAVRIITSLFRVPD